ncbi:MAG TPA: hypothetical protein DCX39_00260 [Firmicutes bacterium]|jgi:nitroreductase|nr:nitroreductase [Clostridium sp. CAG:288]HAR47262.1 hypothetical protein [Bacillota bacterium]HAW99596.1 hypothetical protein [Bacillota bacterium]
MEKKDFIDLLKNRVSVRSFLDKEVSDEDINFIMDAGKMAPTGMNRQPLLFIALKNKDIRKKYADLIKEFTERPTDAYYDSPVVILFFSKDSPTKVLDGAAALENMLLATAAIDLGACWIHRSSFFFASEKGKQFQKEIGIGEEYECLESIALGYIKGDKPQFKERVEGSKII